MRTAVPEEATTQSTTFADLGLRPELLQALSELGYEEPTPIQAAAIPVLVQGHDLLGQAATGTGKTAAFALPILQCLKAGTRGRLPVAMVLVPTRELAMQVSEALHRYGRGLGVRVVPVYGGQPIGRQLRSLEVGVDVVVATPGRALDHLQRGSLDLSELEVVVLDEADEMLDMGFAEDLEAIFDATPTERQTVLFSATLPKRIDAIAKKHQRNPERIRIVDEVKSAEGAARVRHSAYIVQRSHKAAALGRILDVESPTAALVFCRTREAVDSLTETMNGRGYRSEALHGGMSQDQRDRVMGRLRGGTADLLVATDVAARGLDIDHLSHVINFDVPSSVDTYVHRMGRVGRAGREGVAITLAEPREHRMLKTIEHVTKQKITVEKIPTVADLRARRLDVTTATLREQILEGNLDGVRVVVESLAEEFDLMEIALAAVHLAHSAIGGPEDGEDIPEVSLSSAPKGPGRDRDRDRDRDRPRDDRPAKGRRPSNQGSSGSVRLYVSLGREAGLRPQDLVGAIAGETSLSGRDIGSIEISGRFSLVDVPEGSADEVISALRETKIRGRKVTVRRERF